MVNGSHVLFITDWRGCESVEHEIVAEVLEAVHAGCFVLLQRYTVISVVFLNLVVQLIKALVIVRVCLFVIC